MYPMYERSIEKWLPLCLVCVLTCPQLLMGQNAPCTDSLRDARLHYDRGFFDRTIAALGPCWGAGEHGLERVQQREVLLMLANAYLYEDQRDSTDLVVRQLMKRVDQSYRANTLEDPILIQEMVSKHRIRWWERRGVQIAVGAAITGALIYIVTRQGPESLGGAPENPPPPGQ